jgi:hypothetical protein
LIEAVKRIVAGIEPCFQKQIFVGSLFDHNFDVVQLPAKLPGKFVENASDFFSDFVLIQR